MTTRRNFVKLATVSALAAAPLINAKAKTTAAPKVAKSYPLGVAGYTFLEYKGDIDKIISVMKPIGVNYISLKNFQLPFESDKQQAAEIVGKFKEGGIDVYGLGVIYLKTEKDIDNAFNYAQVAGVKMIIVSPIYEVLPYLEKQAKAFGIKVAIHNHGPEDKLFPDIDKIHEKIKNMDPLIGICFDIGHSFRCGNDPAAMLLKYKDRIYDMHIKDVEGAYEKAKPLVVGKGKLDVVSFLKALDKSGYTGICSLEYEEKGEPSLGLAQSIGYVRGILASV